MEQIFKNDGEALNQPQESKLSKPLGQGCLIKEWQPPLELVSTLNDAKESIGGQEKLKRLKQAVKNGDYVLLGLEDLQNYMEHPELIPEVWKEKTNEITTRIFFHGKILEDSNGEERVEFLWWSGFRWLRGSELLKKQQDASTPSAVLKKANEVKNIKRAKRVA